VKGMSELDCSRRGFGIPSRPGGGGPGPQSTNRSIDLGAPGLGAPGFGIETWDRGTTLRVLPGGVARLRSARGTVGSANGCKPALAVYWLKPQNRGEVPVREALLTASADSV